MDIEGQATDAEIVLRSKVKCVWSIVKTNAMSKCAASSFTDITMMMPAGDMCYCTNLWNSLCETARHSWSLNLDSPSRSRAIYDPSESIWK